ncbi:MAG: hypothetical protein ABEJ69_00475 [Candidatus Nanohaloarchaea archaeon]
MKKEITNMVYYQCPECGFKQRSEAEKRIKCHRCGRSYKRAKAKTFKKKTGDGPKGFFTYSKKD